MKKAGTEQNALYRLFSYFFQITYIKCLSEGRKNL